MDWIKVGIPSLRMSLVGRQETLVLKTSKGLLLGVMQTFLSCTGVKLTNNLKVKLWFGKRLLKYCRYRPIVRLNFRLLSHFQRIIYLNS